MKLLLDENLSRRIVPFIQDRYPVSTQIALLGLEQANELMRPIHERMPVILAPGSWNAWLESAAHDARSLQHLLKPYPDEEMTVWRVSRKVNNPRNDMVECIEALE